MFVMLESPDALLIGSLFPGQNAMKESYLQGLLTGRLPWHEAVTPKSLLLGVYAIDLGKIS